MPVNRRAINAFARDLFIMFAAVTLGTLQFIENSLPGPGAVRVPGRTIDVVILGGILIPTLALLAIDRLLAARDRSGRSARRFRMGVFAVALVLFCRQLQLYFGPVNALTSTLEAVPLLPVLAFAAVTAGIVVACRRYPEQLQQYFLMASPVALILVGLAFVHMSPKSELPGNYDTEAPQTGNPELPPVFLITFDELAFSLVSDDEGQPDASRYPNLAALADDSVWFTNATTNNFHTPLILPGFARAAAELRPDYDVVLYDQFSYVEELLWDECGTVYTCRGANHLAASGPSLTKQLLTRAFFEVPPADAKPLVGEVAGFLGYDHPYPHTDPLGIHTFMPETFDEFMSDIRAEEAGGTVYFYHPLLPHFPFVYSADGSLATTYDKGGDPEALWAAYEQQMMYTDSLIGRFVERLRSEGLYEDAIIVLTADHGLRRADTEVTEAIEITDETAHVPLLIKAPGLAPAVSDVDYQHMDYGATLLDIVGMEPAAGARGVSAFSEQRPQRDKMLFLGAANNTRHWVYRREPGTGAWEIIEYVETGLDTQGAPLAGVID
ncbi:MAG: sulfatase-like hydrolase/transferase [Dehalococcoidia bacterium]